MLNCDLIFTSNLVVGPPNAFNNSVNSMLYSKDTISVADVKSTLNSMELRTRLNGKGCDNQAECLFVKDCSDNYSNFRGQSNGRDLDKGDQSQSNSMSKVKSYYCKKFGHYKSECQKLKNKQEGGKQSSSSVTGVVEENDEGSNLVLAITISDSRFYDKWVLDTPCTAHMSHKRDWVINYEPVNGGSVLMANDVEGKIAGFGMVRIRMHDRTVKILKNVQHVPYLKKNLISLGTLDSLGYDYSGEDGVIRVKKGSLVVM